MATLEEIFDDIPDDGQVINVKWNYEAYLYDGEQPADKWEEARKRFDICTKFIAQYYGHIFAPFLWFPPAWKKS